MYSFDRPSLPRPAHRGLAIIACSWRGGLGRLTVPNAAGPFPPRHTRT